VDLLNPIFSLIEYEKSPSKNKKQTHLPQLINNVKETDKSQDLLTFKCKDQTLSSPIINFY